MVFGPEWKHYKHDPSLKGSQKVDCLCCGSNFSSTSATRLRGHLLGLSALGGGRCSYVLVTAEEQAAIKQEMQHIQDSADAVTAQKKRKADLTQLVRTNSDPTAGSKTTQTTVPSRFAKIDRASVDAAIARAFYFCGLPFSVIDDPLFREALKLVRAFSSQILLLRTGSTCACPASFCSVAISSVADKS